ncbi:8142_t:CDS:1, partial [Scutellospora calospora]
ELIVNESSVSEIKFATMFEFDRVITSFYQNGPIQFEVCKHVQ